MGTTTNYAIPYPEPTDFVTDGATAMENIAEKVDAQMFAQVANRNLLYNGAMQIAQRATSVAGLVNTQYRTADRWSINIVAQGTWTNSVENDAPTGSGFRKSLKMLCTTIDASPTGTDEVTIDQRLEGQDVQAIRKGTSSAQSLTISFWVKANLSGTYIVMLYDLDNARYCSKSYVINATATWEYKTITFPADTTGAFDNDNNASLLVRFYLGAGTNFTGGTLQTTWGTDTTANRAVGQVNLAATVNNYWQVTGTQLTIGTVAPPFQFKSSVNELIECQRYYEKGSYRQKKTNMDTARSTYDPVQYKVTKRATPTTVSNTNTDTLNVGSATFTAFSDDYAFISWTSTSSVDYLCTVNWTASAELT